jgi:hypothetical protein
MPYSAKDPER